MKLLLLLTSAALLFLPGCSKADEVSTKTLDSLPLWGEARHGKPVCVKGIHLTSWYAGSKKARAKFEKLLAETELNTAVIDIKEVNGEVYIPGVKLDGDLPVYVPAVRDIETYLTYLKDRGIFTIARLTVFQDQKLAQEKPEWAVHSSSPLPKAVEKGFRSDVWVDRRGLAWADPYNRHVWDYNLDVAVRAAELGFQGIQFDYIRFPSDGPTKYCVYSKPHSRAAAVEALAAFLKRAHEKLKPMGVEISIDVFGLTGSTGDDLGIGQQLWDIVDHVDVVSPMMYPSHYAPGEFGIKDPNSSPYETVFRSVSDTRKALHGKPVEMRPFLQDFSLGVKYTAKHVRDQIQAAADSGISEWLLWNPGCHYTAEALLPN